MREFTNKLMQAIEDGLIDNEAVVNMCMSYMSEDDVKDMCLSNDLFQDEEDYDDSMDGDFDSAMTSAGFGTDEDYGYYGE